MLNEVYDKIVVCSKKMLNASKFIDFFVHDILDYTILNKDETNFKKKINLFCIKDAVEEIIETEHDKANMKNIRVDTKFYGFDDEDNFIVKSDKKRI